MGIRSLILAVSGSMRRTARRGAAHRPHVTAGGRQAVDGSGSETLLTTSPESASTRISRLRREPDGVVVQRDSLDLGEAGVLEAIPRLPRHRAARAPALPCRMPRWLVARGQVVGAEAEADRAQHLAALEVDLGHGQVDPVRDPDGAVALADERGAGAHRHAGHHLVRVGMDHGDVARVRENDLRERLGLRRAGAAPDESQHRASGESQGDSARARRRAPPARRQPACSDMASDASWTRIAFSRLPRAPGPGRGPAPPRGAVARRGRPEGLPPDGRRDRAPSSAQPWRARAGDAPARTPRALRPARRAGRAGARPRSGSSSADRRSSPRRPSSSLDRRVERELVERRPPPKGDRPVEGRGGLLGASVTRVPAALLGPALEAVHVEPLGSTRRT